MPANVSVFNLTPYSLMLSVNGAPAGRAHGWSVMNGFQPFSTTAPFVPRPSAGQFGYGDNAVSVQFDSRTVQGSVTFDGSWNVSAAILLLALNSWRLFDPGGVERGGGALT